MKTAAGDGIRTRVSSACPAGLSLSVPAEILVVLLDPGDVLLGCLLDFIQLWIVKVRMDQAGPVASSLRCPARS